MIKPLEMAVARIQQLPEAEQERVARFVLHELDEEAAWLASSESEDQDQAIFRMTTDGDSDM